MESVICTSSEEFPNDHLQVTSDALAPDDRGPISRGEANPGHVK
jgi:hypothetical protein